MTNREPTEAELTDRARQLSHDVGHLHGVVKRRKETLRAAEEQLFKISCAAASPDGLVRATVDAGGMLTRLDLAADTAGRAPDQLAELITAVTQQAAADARAAVRQIFTQLQNEGVVRDMPVLLPEPARTATPPARQRRHVVEDEPSYEDAPSVLRREGR